MKSSIGFVGIGQCGGNIVEQFEGEYNAFYINTSLEDLQTLKSNNYYHIKEANGSNHNRNKAINYMKNHYKDIVENILNKFNENEIIYLVFSTGGGTGSGISPLLLELLSSNCKNKVFGAVCVLPDINEPVNVQTNAYNCMIQLSKIKSIGSVFVLDNSKNNKEAVNKEFYTAFNNVINLPNYTSKKGNIDTAEVKEMLSMRGIANISVFENNDVSNIIKSLKRNCFSYQDNKKLVYMALSLKEDVDIDSLNRYVGIPYDIFTNYNTVKNTLFLSGMSFPADRIKVIKGIIDNQKKEMESIIDNSKNNHIKNELEWDVQLKNNSKPLDFSEIFQKYQ